MTKKIIALCLVLSLILSSVTVPNFKVYGAVSDMGLVNQKITKDTVPVPLYAQPYIGHSAKGLPMNDGYLNGNVTVYPLTAKSGDGTYFSRGFCIDHYKAFTGKEIYKKPEDYPSDGGDVAPFLNFYMYKAHIDKTMVNEKGETVAISPTKLMAYGYLAQIVVWLHQNPAFYKLSQEQRYSHYAKLFSKVVAYWNSGWGRDPKLNINNAGVMYTEKFVRDTMIPTIIKFSKPDENGVTPVPQNKWKWKTMTPVNSSASQRLIFPYLTEKKPNKPKVVVAIIKHDENGNPLAGAKFEAKYGDEPAVPMTYNQATKRYESPEIFLPEGTEDPVTVTIKEVEAPKGYKKAPTDTWTVKADPKTNNTVETAFVYPEPIVNTTTTNNGGGGGETHPPSGENGGGSTIEYGESPVAIEKVDKVTKEKLAGAIFNIKSLKNGIERQETTDENGEIKIQCVDPTSTNDYYPEGEYTVTEITPPDGYALANENTKNIIVKLIKEETTDDKGNKKEKYITQLSGKLIF